MAATVFKAIVPKKLNVDGFRLEILNALRKEGTVQKQELRKTVTTWTDRPSFETKISLARQGGASVHTFPTGGEDAVNHWNWIDAGTAVHVITARNAPTLIFQSGYTARTSPGKFVSGQSSRHGAWRRPRSVRHPGIAPRNWSKDLSIKRQKPFEERINGAIHRAAMSAFK